MSYYALLENRQQHYYTATVLGWPDVTAQGATRQEVLSRLRQTLQQRLAQVEIVSLDVESPAAGHPWPKFAGMFKDNSLFDEVIADIQAYRRELDADEAAP